MVGRAVVAGKLEFGQSVKAARRGMKAAGLEHRMFPPGGLAQGRIDGLKVEGFNFHHFEKTGQPGGLFQTAAVNRQVDLIQFAAKNYPKDLDAALKVPGISFSGYGEPGYKAQGFNVTPAQRYREEQGTKQEGSGPEWFDQGIAKHSSRSDYRKAASAQIAKIPLPLSSYIARAFKPPALPAPSR
jgi:hypothetical protein